MPAKPATPERYLVDKTGTPDPSNSEYFVMDIVNDFDARVALAFLGRAYEKRGMEVRAQECFGALAKTVDAHQAMCEAKNPKGKAAKTTTRVRGGN